MRIWAGSGMGELKDTPAASSGGVHSAPTSAGRNFQRPLLPPPRPQSNEVPRIRVEGNTDSVFHFILCFLRSQKLPVPLRGYMHKTMSDHPQPCRDIWSVLVTPRGEGQSLMFRGAQNSPEHSYRCHAGPGGRLLRTSQGSQGMAAAKEQRARVSLSSETPTDQGHVFPHLHSGPAMNGKKNGHSFQPLPDRGRSPPSPCKSGGWDTQTGPGEETGQLGQT